MVKTIILPSSYFDRRKVDEDLEQEYAAALSTGLYDIIIFGYEDWFVNGRIWLTHRPDHETEAVYRGWMMKPEQYMAFYDQLLESNIRLITDPVMYYRMHAFPNIYPQIQEDTARMIIFPLHSFIDVAEIRKQFNRFMVKDYVKSIKGTEFPAFFDSSISQEDFEKWMEVFYKYRGDLLTGGICIKEYLDLKRYADRTNEFRAFYINHEIASLCRNSLQGTFTPEPPRTLVEKYKDLGSIFYTIDYAELADGSWKIIEVGDGSVSGLSDRQDYNSFFRSLYQCLN